MTILFLNLQKITRSDIRPHIKWAVSLLIAYGHFNLPQEVCVGIYRLTYSLYHPRGLLNLRGAYPNANQCEKSIEPRVCVQCIRRPYSSCISEAADVSFKYLMIVYLQVIIRTIKHVLKMTNGWSIEPGNMNMIVAIHIWLENLSFLFAWWLNCSPIFYACFNLCNHFLCVIWSCGLFCVLICATIFSVF